MSGENFVGKTRGSNAKSFLAGWELLENDPQILKILAPK